MKWADLKHQIVLSGTNDQLIMSNANPKSTSTARSPVLDQIKGLVSHKSSWEVCFINWKYESYFSFQCIHILELWTGVYTTDSYWQILVHYEANFFFSRTRRRAAYLCIKRGKKSNYKPITLPWTRVRDATVLGKTNYYKQRGIWDLTTTRPPLTRNCNSL
jgi:hypothetical protein